MSNKGMIRKGSATALIIEAVAHGHNKAATIIDYVCDKSDLSPGSIRTAISKCVNDGYIVRKGEHNHSLYSRGKTTAAA